MRKTLDAIFLFLACAVILPMTILGGPIIAGAVLFLHFLVNGRRKERDKQKPRSSSSSNALAERLILSHSAEEFIKRL